MRSARWMAVVVVAAGLAVGTGCKSGGTVADGGAAPTARLFKGMGTHERKVTTTSPEAQKYFNQGLIWAYAFNHDEAIRAFTEAARLDPNCAMAHWGLALVNGPHINNAAMDEEHSRAAWDALQRAKAVADNASPVEKALIKALEARYVDPAAGKLPLDPTERAPLDKAYAAAMKKVHDQFPADNDVLTLRAEAMMDLRPWDLYSQDQKARPETPEIVALLEAVLIRDPLHPGANHLYIHAVEASKDPGRATAAAERLTKLVPTSGHLVHMPAHIFARTGRWADAAESNRQAIAADKAYRAIVPSQGFYNIYMAHNHGFLAWGCMMMGRKHEALAASRAMVAGIPPEFVKNAAQFVDGVLQLPLGVMMRFGEWQMIMDEPQPADFLPISNAMWRFNRGVALANLGRMSEAENERSHFREAITKIPKDWKVGNTDQAIVMTIAGHVLDAEIAYRSGAVDDAIAHLHKAVAAEDTVRYNEPPDWLQPTRHTLGAFLLEAGNVKEAEAVYREDLERWPENGWALFGLAQCMKARKSNDALLIEARYERAWSKADTKIHATCLCVPKQR